MTHPAVPAFTDVPKPEAAAAYRAAVWRPIIPDKSNAFCHAIHLVPRYAPLQWIPYRSKVYMAGARGGAFALCEATDVGSVSPSASNGIVVIGAGTD